MLITKCLEFDDRSKDEDNTTNDQLNYKHLQVKLAVKYQNHGLIKSQIQLINAFTNKKF